MTTLQPAQIGHLVAGLLSVNQYPLSRARALMPGIAAQGLLEPATVLGAHADLTTERLRAAGYDRGGFAPILARRLYPLMRAIEAGELESLPAAVAADARDEFVRVLSGVFGFGPTTAGAAWASWKSEPVNGSV
jgi:hypothetical protein